MRRGVGCCCPPAPPGGDARPSQGNPLAVLYMHVTGTHSYTSVKRDKIMFLVEGTNGTGDP